MAEPTSTILDRDQGRPSRSPLRSVLREHGLGVSVVVAVVFCLLISTIICLGRYHSGYRLGQYLTQPVHARVDFSYFDASKFEYAQQRASELEPRVYSPNPRFSWAGLEEQVRRWPDIVAGKSTETLPEVLRSSFDHDTLVLLVQYQAPEKRGLYNQRVESFFAAVKRLVVISQEQRDQEIRRHQQWRVPSGFSLRIIEGEGGGSSLLPLERIHVKEAGEGGSTLAAEIKRAASESFREDLAPRVAQYVTAMAQSTHVLDENATAEAQARAAAMVLGREGEVQYKAGVAIKQPGQIGERDLGVLQAEHRAYRQSLAMPVVLRDFGGVAGIVVIITAVIAWYVSRYQPRILRNHARSIAMAMLLVAMLLISQLAGPGTRPLFIFGIAPTILTAMILAIAYEPRFALGISMLLTLMVALSLNQGMEFLLILLGGCCAACAFTGTVRTRGKLIEIGLASALAMAAIAVFCGVWAFSGAVPFEAVLTDAFHTALAGLGSGFVVLGILPFVEKAFRITTGMTLLELSDASHPVQRKIAAEAPGTYSHSLQVASIAESAAEAIGANSLLARVGALYHDLGKTRRPHYFCENQNGAQNAHLSLSPSVSFMIIIEHIKDGLELARQHNLPTSLHPFIQQHHGTTLVEYFYHEACKSSPLAQHVSESEFRYPGPKPRSREVAIVMLADACESASRAVTDPHPDAIEKLIHQIVLKRLLDGQLSECDLTLHELDTVEKTMTRALQGAHHARVAYPESSRQSPVAAAAGM